MKQRRRSEGTAGSWQKSAEEENEKQKPKLQATRADKKAEGLTFK